MGVFLVAAATACGGSDSVTAGAPETSGAGLPASASGSPAPTSTAASAADPSSTSGGAAATETSVKSGPTSAVAATSKLPAIDLVNVNTGQPVSLASLGGGDKPILFWAWAPH